MRGSHESSRGLLQAASARDGAQAKRRSRPLLATFGIDALVCIRESVGREPTVRTTAADSGQDGQRRRSTTNRPSHLQAPSAFCSLAWRALRLRDDETAGVVPWCDCASGQRLFRLSGRLHRRDDAARSLLRTTIRAAARCSSSTTTTTTTEQRLLALRLSCPWGGHFAVRTCAVVCIQAVCIHGHMPCAYT